MMNLNGKYVTSKAMAGAVTAFLATIVSFLMTDAPAEDMILSGAELIKALVAGGAGWLLLYIAPKNAEK